MFGRNSVPPRLHAHFIPCAYMLCEQTFQFITSLLDRHRAVVGHQHEQAIANCAAGPIGMAVPPSNNSQLWSAINHLRLPFARL